MRRRLLALVPLALLGGPPAVATATGPVAASADEVRPLAVGEPAPSVTCRDVDGAPVPLDTWVGREAVALIFYRGGW